MKVKEKDRKEEEEYFEDKEESSDEMMKDVDDRRNEVKHTNCLLSMDSIENEKNSRKLNFVQIRFEKNRISID